MLVGGRWCLVSNTFFLKGKKRNTSPVPLNLHLLAKRPGGKLNESSLLHVLLITQHHPCLKYASIQDPPNQIPLIHLPAILGWCVFVHFVPCFHPRAYPSGRGHPNHQSPSHNPWKICYPPRQTFEQKLFFNTGKFPKFSVFRELKGQGFVVVGISMRCFFCS